MIDDRQARGAHIDEIARRIGVEDNALLLGRLFRDASDQDRRGIHPFDVVTVNDMTSADGLIKYLGKATRQTDGTWQAIAITPIGICVVEVAIRFALPDHDPGDEDPKARR